MTFLKICNVSKHYAEHQALNNVSLDVNAGSIYGLLGPNGAGKTTLIRIINNITAPDSGEVLLNGRRLTFEDTVNIGYLPEERGLYKKMKVGEQAMYLCRLKGLDKNYARKQLKYWFEKFAIENWWDKKVEELSKGMAQKVQFITTVLHEPQLLIFDEPFSGFDPLNADLLRREILELRDKGATVLFSTHNMASVEEMCDHIALINHAEVVLHGAVRDIRETHKRHIYTAELYGTAVPDSDKAPFDIIECQETDNRFMLRLQAHHDATGNDILTALMSVGEVLRFAEELPTMNDIFIETVKQTDVNNTFT